MGLGASIPSAAWRCFPEGTSQKLIAKSGNVIMVLPSGEKRDWGGVCEKVTAGSKGWLSWVRKSNKNKPLSTDWASKVRPSGDRFKGSTFLKVWMVCRFEGFQRVNFPSSTTRTFSSGRKRKKVSF